MGTQTPPAKRRLTWHTTSGLLLVLSVVLMLASLALYVDSLFSVRNVDDWPVVFAANAVTAAFLARWAEVRHRTYLGEQILAVSEETVAIMRSVAAGTSDPEAATDQIIAAQRKVQELRDALAPK